jgi:hypothetical protein
MLRIPNEVLLNYEKIERLAQDELEIRLPELKFCYILFNRVFALEILLQSPKRT